MSTFGTGSDTSWNIDSEDRTATGTWSDSDPRKEDAGGGGDFIVNNKLFVAPVPPGPSTTTSSSNVRTENSTTDHYNSDSDDNNVRLDGRSDSSGALSDMEDMDMEQGIRRRRKLSGVKLPDTVTQLKTENGGAVYLIGTAHFSKESQQDVENVIQTIQPDVVLVELCKSRVNILRLDEDTLLNEAKDINLRKFSISIKQHGVLTGVMQVLLLSMSAHITKQLGMAPGGEFRKAFKEAQKVPGCKIHLGDRPIQITLHRAMAALSIWQKMKLAWYMVTCREPISKDDVEKCKQKDLLEEMLEEMTGEFPMLSRVFVTERDAYLAYTLRQAAQPVSINKEDGKLQEVPAVVVGVVGIGHCPGIVNNWNKKIDIDSIMSVPGPSVLGTIVRWSFRVSVFSVFGYGCYQLYRWTNINVFTSS